MQKRVVTKSNTRYDVGGAKRDLFHFRKKFVDHSIQHHLPDNMKRDQLFRPYFCRVKRVKLEVVLLSLRDNLDTELPLWKSTVLNCLREVLSMKV